MRQVPVLLSILGDGYPKDQGIEDFLTTRLGIEVYPYARFLADHLNGTHTTDLDARELALRQAVLQRQDRAVIVAARSAAAIVAARVAHRNPGMINGLIVFGYPFRHPEREPEAYRLEALERLTIPTLILQGTRDIYGTTREWQGHFAQPNLTFCAIDCDHEFQGPAAIWPRILQEIEGFLWRL